MAKAKKAMSKSALYAHLADESGLKKTDVATIMDLLAEAVKSQLSGKGVGTFTLPGLARFKVRKVKAVKGGQTKINPITKSEYVTKDKPAHNKVSIRPVKSFSESLK